MTDPKRFQQLLQFDQRLRFRRNIEPAALAGVDEAGRGPLAGPVVACALRLHQSDFSVRVDDSKRLSAQGREAAYRQILQRGDIGVGLVAQDQVDRMGIGPATDWAMCLAIRRLGLLPQLVLVDGRRVPAGCPVAALPVVEGDARSLRIACASIVAKVLRDRWMERLHRLLPEYGFARHKGYGTRAHRRALRLLGPSQFHRYSFRPICGGFPLAQGSRVKA